MVPVREQVGSRTPVWKYLIAAALHMGQTSVPGEQRMVGWAASSDWRKMTVPVLPPVTRIPRGGGAEAEASVAGGEAF